MAALPSAEIRGMHMTIRWERSRSVAASAVRIRSSMKFTVLGRAKSQPLKEINYARRVLEEPRNG